MKEQNAKPLLVIVAGGNGAGKTTFYREYLRPTGLPFINADVIAREYWPEAQEEHSYQALLIAEETRMQALKKRRSFCFESVFSHPSKLEFMRQVQDAGYHIDLYVIHLQHPDLNVGRVAQRVSEGGHSVPQDKIYNRIPKAIENLKQAAHIANQVVLLDNSRYDAPYQVQARWKEGSWTLLQDAPAPWALEFTSDK